MFDYCITPKNTMSGIVLLQTVLLLLAVHCARAQDTITGTIFANNNASFYINGELIAVDPIHIVPHNAFNVSFQVPAGQDITFAIEAIDIADDVTGLELDNRCLGAGGLRAMFSNGVVTDSSWKCYTWHYGPVNWKECFAAEERAGALKVFPACLFSVLVGDGFEGCFSRLSPIPEGWADPDFDESGWEYATVWNDTYVRPFVWPVLPIGCSDPGTVISSQADDNGVNLTCPNNLDWGTSEFIWRPDIDLDNRILCRYTLKQSGALAMMASATAAVLSAVAAALLA